MASVLLLATPAAAHSYSATVYAMLTEIEPGLVRTVLDVEYVLLATDGARKMNDAQFERDAYDDVQASGQDPTKLTTRVLEAHSATVLGYVLPRYALSVVGKSDAPACPTALAEPYAITYYDAVPHARLVIDTDCRGQVSGDRTVYRISTGLFPGTEPGGKTTTVVTYDLNAGSGVASLDTDTNPTFTTAQDWPSRMGEFFVLGAKHLMFGLDHILFLLALIVASRQLRDIVMVTTAFTVAHSVTFILAALGVVSVPAIIVEPLIALSIAVVALWYLWRRWREGKVVPNASTETSGRGIATLTRADWLRIAVVFGFGLVHGIGFAGALGINEQFSWGLLGALLVFNLGIEAAQLTIILLAFPLLMLVRTRAPRVGDVAALTVSAVVAVVGFVWFAQRLAGA